MERGSSRRLGGLTAAGALAQCRVKVGQLQEAYGAFGAAVLWLSAVSRSGEGAKKWPLKGHFFFAAVWSGAAPGRWAPSARRLRILSRSGRNCAKKLALEGQFFAGLVINHGFPSIRHFFASKKAVVPTASVKV